MKHSLLKIIIITLMIAVSASACSVFKPGYQRKGGCGCAKDVR
ncbi:MAG: hypothetical protein ACK4X2_01530 [Bacteroidota bacterium]